MSAFTKSLFVPLLLIALLCIPSCSKDEGTSNSTSSAKTETTAGVASFWKGKATDASSAQPVIAIRKDAKEGAEVKITGRIKDFSPKLAVFTLTDSTLKSCAETDDDQCPTPWDYCCIEANVIAESTVTVEFRNDKDRPFREGLKGFQGLKNLDHVVINGTAHRDEAGNVIIVASSFARP